MMIKQFRYSHDNLGYLVYSGNDGIAIDPGAVSPMLDFAVENDIVIHTVTNTHSHEDHTKGNQAMLNSTGAGFLDCKTVTDGQTITLNGQPLKIVTTPGHTLDSISFTADDFMVTGDTLFNGTVGNCFSGDLDAFYHSLKKLLEYPKETKIFSGHDYVREAMAAAIEIEKDNPHISEYLEAYNPELIASTLEAELKVNPYIRFNAQNMIKQLESIDAPAGTEIDRFKSIFEHF